MLDSDTKRRIDTCRDILVGKVPDPKSQVEQITIALIYKFMDDMDMQAKELGGKRSFFINGFEQYAWTKLMAPSLGGADMLKLYSEAIGKMTENTHLPELFRDIFKNAYLPYRDPETLKSFLKEINAFTYDHSEKLGDAFEYLLSVLGSQGDAGQFRTPRHIIDFVVEILKPQKHEVVLDPACGTAGFLISAYKYILNTNTTKLPSPGSGRGAGGEGHSTKPGNTLTPAERKKLAQNFKGYDISPDMVRLSLVNLYLHGFKEPHIFEYDTLTSDDRWNEYADVILANPPFMSPKGGIKPHKRFSVKSKRSEVLFVDYMAEHLSPTGRAGIIVPEGIIFQSQGSYVELRKLLVEQSLVAVISLPAGVFNPYSGVKTSILILDKQLAKKASSIAFFKVENDGFGLGAQRRAIDKNDLPTVQAELEAYLQSLRAGVESPALTTGHIVPKEKLAANGDYNLSGERYRDGVVASASKWPFIPLGELTRRVSGGTPSKQNDTFWRGTIPWVSPKDMKHDVLHDTEDHVSEAAVKDSATSLIPAGTLLCVVRSGILKHSLPLAITGREMCFNQDIVALIPADSRLDVRYLYWVLKARSAEILEKGIKPGVTVQSFHSGFFGQFQIPLPPLEVQKEIVAEIEGYQKVINGARAVIDNYRPHIPIHPEWPVFELSEVTTKITDGAHFTPTYVNDGIPFLRVTDITESNNSKKFIPQSEHDELIKRCRPEKGDVLYSKNGTIGIAKLIDWDWEFSIFVSLCLIKPKRKLLDPHYLTCFLNSDAAYAQATARSKSGTVTNLHLVDIKTMKIPLPDFATQQAIVAEIEAEQALVAANRELIARFENKIQATLARVWGDAPATDVVMS